MKRIPAPIVMVFLMITIFAACSKEVQVAKPPVVDAGNSLSIKVNDDSVLLTATVSESEGQITSYLWRKLTGEGSPEFVTPNESSTWVKNLTNGNYVFQLMVQDEKGNIGSDTVTVEVIANDTVIFAAAPTNNVNEVHLFGNATSIDQTDTIAPELLGGSGTYLGDPVDIRALLKFDLSTIPSESRIVSAKLTLFSNPTPLNGIGGYPNYGTNNALLIQRVAESWIYNTVNWLYQPAGSTTDQLEIPHTDELSLDLVDLDVKKLVDAMRSEGNNGFLIRLQTEEIYNFRIFCSSKYADAAKHPKLDIVYTK